MRPQLPDNILVILLRQCYLAPKCRSAIERPKVHSLFLPRYLRTSARQSHHGEGPDRDRNTVQDSRSRTQEDGSVLAQPVHLLPTAQYSTQSQYRTSPQNIAILGGGITGLSSAFYLSKSLPSANITLYEASDRLGGWLRSKHVDMGNGKIVFEQGPRTLRPHTPAALVTLELVIDPEAASSQSMLKLMFRSSNWASKAKLSLRLHTRSLRRIDSFTIQITLSRCQGRGRVFSA